METPDLTVYVGRIGPVRVTATEGTERITLTLLGGIEVQLDQVESGALLRCLLEARRRASTTRKEP